MRTFSPLQRKSRTSSTSETPTSRQRSFHRLAPAPVPTSEQATSDLQMQPAPGTHLQHSFANIPVSLPKRENHTGLPDNIKARIEHLSRLPMDDVHVHYNSPKPASVQALAYTQGTDIHIGPQQEPLLGHEAWHVVQQKQGRVRPTIQARGMPVNDDQELEREADTMGAKTAGSKAIAKPSVSKCSGEACPRQEPNTHNLNRFNITPAPSQGIIQGTFKVVNYTFGTAQDVEDNKQKILNEIPKKSGPSGNDVVKLLKKWAKDDDNKGRFLSYKALARAGLKALREEQAKGLPPLASVKIKTGGSKNYDRGKLPREEKIKKLRKLHRAASTESIREAKVRAHRDTDKMVSLEHKDVKTKFNIGYTTNFLTGGPQESDYKTLFAEAKNLSGLSDKDLAIRLIKGLHGEKGYLDGLKDDAKSYFIKILALIQGPEFRRSGANPTAATAALNKVVETNKDIYQTLLDNALFTISEKVAEPGGSVRSQFHRIDFIHNEEFQKAAANQYDTIIELADANGVDVNDEAAVETFVKQTTKSTVGGLTGEFDLATVK